MLQQMIAYNDNIICCCIFKGGQIFVSSEDHYAIGGIGLEIRIRTTATRASTTPDGPEGSSWSGGG